MKRFQFRLERVLHWYETQVSLEEQKLRKLVQLSEQLQMRIRHIEAQALAARADVMHYADMHGCDLQNLSAFQGGVDVEKTKLRAQYDECRARIEVQRGVLLEARLKRESLLRLKQRRLDQWTREQDREEENLALENFLAGFEAR